MTDETTTPPPENPTSPEAPVAESVGEVADAVGTEQTDAEPAPEGPSASAAWDGVVVAIGDLGDAIGAWARAASDNPENRRHLDEVRGSVNDMAQKAGTMFTDVANSEFGQQVRQSADDAGQAFADTAQKVSEAAAPHVASAFAGLADVFGRAAQRAGEAAAPRPTTPSDDEAPSRPAPEPPSQSPSPAEPETSDGKDAAHE